MAAPIVYRWDDGNAPVARGERRSLCDILYACLVTGYGDKAAAGWTREYVNATFDKAVFRNSPVVGKGRYLRIDGAGASSAYTTNISAYEVMTSVDDGLFPLCAFQRSAWTSFTANTTARPWVLIADEAFFYFFCWPGITSTPTTANNETNGIAFGDPIVFKADDAYACALMTCDSSIRTNMGYMYSPSNTFGNASYGVCSSRNYAGVATPIISALIRGGGPGADIYAGASGIPRSTGDAILVSRPHINDATTYSLRGWLPGYYYPCHPNAFGQLAEVVADGKTFLSIRHNVYGQAGNSFILLSDWRA